MTPREAKTKLDEIKSKLEGHVLTPTGYQSANEHGATGQYIPPDNNKLSEAIEGLVEIVEWMLAERNTERVQKGGF
jgi:hypothetical protein